MTCGKKTKHTSRIGCCPLCKELFSGDTAHGQHRTKVGDDGKRGCVAPASVGLVAKPSRTAPGEVVWSLPAPDEDPDTWTRTSHGPALTRDGFTEALRALGRDGGER